MFTKKNKITKHHFFMNLAFLEARKNLGNTKYNPAVGCVIVKNNNVISAGTTSINGRPHAEHNAIINSKFNVKNSYLYSSLEPCSHYGKTPPCVNTIIKNKIKKVFFSINDIDVRSFKKSEKKLNTNKIQTKSNINSKLGSQFYRSYLKSKQDALPFTTAKIAISKDFFTINKKNKWITNKFSRGRVHYMRSIHDCIITSASTIVKDNPRLNCRIDGLEDRSPDIIIIDKNLKIPNKSNIFKNIKKNSITIIYNKNIIKKVKFLKKKKIKLIRMPLNQKGNFNLKNILKEVKQLGYSRVFLESGINLMSNFINNGLVNDLNVFVSNQKLGRKGENSIKNNIYLYLKKIKPFKIKANLMGDNLFVYRLKNV